MPCVIQSGMLLLLKRRNNRKDIKVKFGFGVWCIVRIFNEFKYIKKKIKEVRPQNKFHVIFCFYYKRFLQNTNF
jgi:hypothetical protein